MTGRKFNLPKGAQLREGKIVLGKKQPRSVSARIAQRKSKKVRVVKKAP